TTATLPFALKIATLGAAEAMRQDPNLAAGLNVSDGKIRHEAVAEALDLQYEPVAAERRPGRGALSVATPCSTSGRQLASAGASARMRLQISTAACRSPDL